MKYTKDIYAYKALFLHIRQLGIQAYIKANGKKPNSEHFPSMTVACEYKGLICCRDSSKNPQAIFYNDRLCNRLETMLLGHIGEKSGPQNFRIGGCAEQIAANSMMRIVEVPNIPDMSFTEAFQPRTLKMRDWCRNCHIIFD